MHPPRMSAVFVVTPNPTHTAGSCALSPRCFLPNAFVVKLGGRGEAAALFAPLTRVGSPGTESDQIGESIICSPISGLHQWVAPCRTAFLVCEPLAMGLGSEKQGSHKEPW